VKTEVVERYACDFCGKRMYDSGLMEHHEQHCTANPDRECGICKMFTTERRDVASIAEEVREKAKVEWTGPDPDIEKSCDLFGPPEPEPPDITKNVWFCDAIPTVKGILPTLDELRAWTDDCPACMLAILKLSGLHNKSILIGKQFNFKKERLRFFKEWNENRDA